MPGIVDQPLPSLNIGVIGGHVIGADRQSIAGQIEEAGSAMIGDAASVINLEAAKTARDAVFVEAAGRSRRVVGGADGGARVRRGGGGRGGFGDAGELVLELLDSFLEALGVRQCRVPVVAVVSG